MFRDLVIVYLVFGILPLFVISILPAGYAYTNLITNIVYTISPAIILVLQTIIIINELNKRN